MYHWWLVRSNDGSLDVAVAAINIHHAMSFFLHEWHPLNLIVEHKSVAKGMTFEEWRTVMKSFIELVPPSQAKDRIAMKM